MGAGVGCRAGALSTAVTGAPTLGAGGVDGASAGRPTLYVWHRPVAPRPLAACLPCSPRAVGQVHHPTMVQRRFTPAVAVQAGSPAGSISGGDGAPAGRPADDGQPSLPAAGAPSRQMPTAAWRERGTFGAPDLVVRREVVW